MLNSTGLWPKKRPKNIIVRMPNWIGDAVMATPILEDLRRYFPECELRVLCQGNIALLLQNNPYINEILSFKRPSGWIHRLHPFEVVEMLQCGEFDLGVLLTNSFSSAWQFWRGGVRNRLGYAGHWRRFLLNKCVAEPEDLEKQHLVLTYKQLLLPLGIAVTHSMPALFISDEERETAHDLLTRCKIDKSCHRIVGINPGAAYGSAKCWLPDRFQAVARRLIESDKNNRVIFFGDPSQKELIASICSDLPDGVLDLAGRTTLREMIALLECCDVILTNDSGPMHIAAALKKPVVAIFGSTNPVKTGPYSDKAVVLRKEVACSPCYKRVCPIDLRCMTQLSVDEVFAAVQAMIIKGT